MYIHFEAMATNEPIAINYRYKTIKLEALHVLQINQQHANVSSKQNTQLRDFALGAGSYGPAQGE